MSQVCELRACSGARKSGVPITEPICVTCVLGVAGGRVFPASQSQVEDLDGATRRRPRLRRIGPLISPLPRGSCQRRGRRAGWPA